MTASTRSSVNPLQGGDRHGSSAVHGLERPVLRVLSTGAGFNVRFNQRSTSLIGLFESELQLVDRETDEVVTAIPASAYLGF